MNVEDGNGIAEACPDAVIIDTCRHHVDQHLMAIELPCWQGFDQHGLFRFPLALAANGPAMHGGWHVAERRNFSQVIEVFGLVAHGAGPLNPER